MKARMGGVQHIVRAATQKQEANQILCITYTYILYTMCHMLHTLSTIHEFGADASPQPSQPQLGS